MKNCLYYSDVMVRDSLQHSFLIHGLMTISGNLSIYARTVNRSWRPCDCPGFFIDFFKFGTVFVYSKA